MSGPANPCRQCFEEYEPGPGDDGFCSDTCEDAFDKELAAPEPAPAVEVCDGGLRCCRRTTYDPRGKKP